MNLSLILMVIWQLESSSGKNMRHPQPNCHGHLGMSDIALRDLAAHGKIYSIEEMQRIDKAFEAAKDYIELYSKPEWTPGEVLRFWRCGPTGMYMPTDK